MKPTMRRIARTLEYVLGLAAGIDLVYAVVIANRGWFLESKLHVSFAGLLICMILIGRLIERVARLEHAIYDVHRIGPCSSRFPRIGGGTIDCHLRAGHLGDHESNDGARWTRYPQPLDRSEVNQ